LGDDVEYYSNNDELANLQFHIVLALTIWWGTLGTVSCDFHP